MSSTVVLSRISPAIKQKASEIAGEKGISLSEYIRSLIISDTERYAQLNKA